MELVVVEGGVLRFVLVVFGFFVFVLVGGKFGDMLFREGLWKKKEVIWWIWSYLFGKCFWVIVERWGGDCNGGGKE